MGQEATQKQSYKNYYFMSLKRSELVKNSESIQGTTT